MLSSGLQFLSEVNDTANIKADCLVGLATTTGCITAVLLGLTDVAPERGRIYTGFYISPWRL